MRFTSLITCAAAIALLSAPAYGLPRFEAKAEQKCNLCHVNPTGGGMRNTFGSQYFAQTELAVHKVSLEEIGKFQPNVSDNIALGADIRTLYIYDENVSQSSFFQMEGNFYLNAQINDRLSMALYKGLYAGFDVYGLGYYLPMEGYVKVGKFQPSYGWRYADHTNFVREKMLWPPNYSDTGLEFGIYPGSVSLNIGLFNGSGSQLDEDEGKALATRIEYRKHLGFLGVALGGSYWRNDRQSGSHDMYGPFGYLSALKRRLILVGEADWLDIGEITSFAWTEELSYEIRQGIWVSAKYDFHDPDIDLKNGATNRYTLSLDYFPIGFFELEPSIRYYSDDVIDDDYVTFVNTFHFYF